MLTGTLCVLVKEAETPEVLLGLVKRSKFQGKIYNFPGGKRNFGESSVECAVRELHEETGIRVLPSDFKYHGELTFLWPDSKKNWNQIIHVYVAKNWTGEAAESNEMTPKWFPINALPLGNMWPADKHWIPKILKGEYVTATFRYDEEKKLVESVFS